MLQVENAVLAPLDLTRLRSQLREVLRHGPITVHELVGERHPEDDRMILELVVRRYLEVYERPSLVPTELNRYLESMREDDERLGSDSTSWIASAPDGQIVGHLRLVPKTARGERRPVEREFGLELDHLDAVAEWGRFVTLNRPDLARHAAARALMQATAERALADGISAIWASITKPVHDIARSFGFDTRQYEGAFYRRI